MKSNRTIESIALKVTMVAFGVLPLMFSAPPVAADDCEWCDRGAVVSKCENPDLPPDFDEAMQRYLECLDREEPKDDPHLTLTQKPDAFAWQRCEHLKPRSNFTTASSIMTRIAELHTSACFHFIGVEAVEAYRERGRREGWDSLIKPADYKIPEYAFEVVFDGVSNEAVDSEGRPGSTLKIDLFYDGDEKILVRSWKTVSPTYTITSHYFRMFRNADAVMRQEPPLQNLLWEFEQTPIGCQIMGEGGDFFVQPDGSSEVPVFSPDSPNDIKVRANETKEIPITGFMGRSGRSKSFNRIIVKVDDGEILNGARLASDPEARVFKVGDGTVKVIYRAPKSCSLEGDTIRVYNSCDIAKTSLIPLAETRERDEIASRNIVCLDSGWTGTATLRQSYQFDCNDAVQEGRTLKKLQQHDRRSERATMSVRCEDFDLANDPIVVLSGGTDIVVSGKHQRSIDESHFSERTWNGCWGNDIITLEGSGSCALAPNTLSVTFRKAGLASADEMRRLIQEMSETITNDPDRYQELSAQLDALMNPGSAGGGTPLKGIVQYGVDCPFAADYREVKKHQCESDAEVKVSDQGTTLEMSFLALTVEFEATYVKGENGKDKIEASYTKTTPHSPPAPFTGIGPHNCPPMIETFEFDLDLQRQTSE